MISARRRITSDPPTASGVTCPYSTWWRTSAGTRPDATFDRPRQARGSSRRTHDEQPAVPAGTTPGIRLLPGYANPLTRGDYALLRRRVLQHEVQGLQQFRA